VEDLRDSTPTLTAGVARLLAVAAAAIVATVVVSTTACGLDGAGVLGSACSDDETCASNPDAIDPDLGAAADADASAAARAPTDSGTGGDTTTDTDTGPTTGPSTQPSILTATDGTTIPIPSKSAGVVTPTHAGNNGGNGLSNRQNAWEVSAVGRCANTVPAVSKIWYHNLDYPSYLGTNQVEFFGVAANEAFVYSFIAPAEGTRGGFQFNESTIATAVPFFGSISTTPCDFDPTRLGAGATSPARGCYLSYHGTGGTLSYFSSTGPASGLAECKLVPGQRYYLNYRSWAASWGPSNETAPVDACLATTGDTTTPCGGLIAFR